ncbi:MAG: lipoyl synthase [bacterium]|nr:lipoyl synthase [bacterium]
MKETPKRQAKPDWLKVSLPKGPEFRQISELTRKEGLATVCEEAKCPNLGECWSSGTATFMLLGEVCTRACRFCSVETAARPAAPDPQEPIKIARTAKALKLKYLVLTCVDRDDLPDLGAAHMAKVVEQVQSANPELMVELLAPDFSGRLDLLELLLEHPPLVLGHNLETVERLSKLARDPRCGYRQSLEVLGHIKKYSPQQRTKSSLLLGLGESREETLQAMKDLREAQVDFLTLGQYLQPTKAKLPVLRYLSPEEFTELGQLGREMGFAYVASGPLVRSSYRAFEYFMAKQ